MLKSLKQNFAPILFAAIGIGLLTFPIWSHFSQDKQIKTIKEIRVNGGEDMLVGASTLFAQNASVQLNLEVLGTYASVSGNFAFYGEIMPDGSTCSNNQFLRKTGANNWDCVSTASGIVASNSLDFDEFVNAMTLDANLSIASTSNNYTWDFLVPQVSFAGGRILSNGNVGIGTTGPGQKLSILDTSQGGTPGLDFLAGNSGMSVIRTSGSASSIQLRNL